MGRQKSSFDPTKDQNRVTYGSDPYKQEGIVTYLQGDNVETRRLKFQQVLQKLKMNANAMKRQKRAFDEKVAEFRKIGHDKIREYFCRPSNLTAIDEIVEEILPLVGNGDDFVNIAPPVQETPLMITYTPTIEEPQNLGEVQQVGKCQMCQVAIQINPNLPYCFNVCYNCYSRYGSLGDVFAQFRIAYGNYENPQYPEVFDYPDWVDKDTWFDLGDALEQRFTNEQGVTTYPFTCFGGKIYVVNSRHLYFCMVAMASIYAEFQYYDNLFKQPPPQEE